MKILVYDWCLHIVGGGQKVNCRIAEYLSKRHDVDILTLFPAKKQNLEGYYSLDLSRIGRIRNIYKKSSLNTSLLSMLVFRKVSKIAKEYDVFINADGHETVKPNAKYNIMYCHFFRPRVYRYRPFKGFFDSLALLATYLFRGMLKNYIKQYDAIYCNSLFSKKWLKKLWKVDAKIIYPFVEIPKRKPKKKENIILVTGRLSPDKNYEFVVDCFKKIYDSGIKNYKCVIAAVGSTEKDEYYNKIKNLIGKYNVKIMANPTNQQLNNLYEKSKIFLMAKGLFVNEEKFPLLLENFGMSAAEAASYGCVPLLLNKGGYKEIVRQGKNGFLFNNREEAIEKLKFLIKNEKILSKMSRNAMQDARKFSLERFYKDLDGMMEKIRITGK